LTSGPLLLQPTAVTAVDKPTITYTNLALCRLQPLSPAAAPGQLSAPTAATAANKSSWGAPGNWKQQQADPVVGANRPIQQHTSTTSKAPAATAGRLDSWDLDDDALPDGSPRTQPAATAASQVSGCTPSSSSRPVSAAAAAAAGGPAPAGKKDDADRQQIVLQMAAALERRAQLQQQKPEPVVQHHHAAQQLQQPHSASNSSDSSPVPSFFHNRQAGGASSYAAGHDSAASTAAASVSSPASEGFGLTTPAGSPNKLSPLAAPSMGYSSRGSSMSRTFGTAAAAAAASVDSGSVQQAPHVDTALGPSTTAAGGVAGGLGGLLSRGLADLGISESERQGTADAAGSAHTAATGPGAAGAAASASAGIPAGVSLLRPLPAPASPAQQARGAAAAAGLPPGVSPIAGRRSPGVLPAATSPQAEAAPAQAQPAAEPVQQQPAAAMAVHAAAEPAGVQSAGSVGRSSSSAAAAVALLSNLTGSAAAPRAASTAGQAAGGQQQQHDHLQPQQQQQQPHSMGHGGPGDFDGQVAAMRQLSHLQGELADAKMSMARLRQQAEEEHSRYAGWMGTRCRHGRHHCHAMTSHSSISLLDGLHVLTSTSTSCRRHMC
jgi:hypothetical protein